MLDLVQLALVINVGGTTPGIDTLWVYLPLVPDRKEQRETHVTHFETKSGFLERNPCVVAAPVNRLLNVDVSYRYRRAS